MKHLSAVIFLFLFAGNADAQKIRFTDTSNRWTIQQATWTSPWSAYEKQFTADTVIGSFQYLYLSNCWVREDTISGIVYYRPTNFNSDTTERILYNYNMQVGDTIRTSVDSGYTHIVNEIDSTLINNTWHKVWTLIPINTFNAPTEYKVIEGIGSNREPTFPVSPSYFEYGRRLICFSTNDTTPVLQPGVYSIGMTFNNSSSCLLVGVHESIKNDKVAAVIPNPITNQSKIVFNSTIKSGQLTVFNSIGQKVMDGPVKDITEYKIGDKITVPGLYYFILTDLTENSTYTGKFVY